MRYRREITLDRAEPWTESEYLDLPGTNTRVELIDGQLRMEGPRSNARGQITACLWDALRKPARNENLRAIGRPGLHLAPGRIVMPDLAMGRFARTGAIGQAADTVLVAEIATPWFSRESSRSDPWSCPVSRNMDDRATW